MEIFELLDQIRDSGPLSLEELERGMTDARTMIDSCRAGGHDGLAEQYAMWLDGLLDEWANRLAGHPAGV